MAFIFKGKAPGRKQKPFWEYVEKTETCWLWRGGTTGNGYGAYRFNKIPRKAHHIAYILTHGELPKLSAKHIDGLVIMHSCDNTLCVNPLHLSLGTHMQNIQDRQMKQRNARGESHSRAKLCEQDVLRIRESYLFGANLKDLCSIYGISKRGIKSIIDRQNWRHI